MALAILCVVMIASCEEAKTRKKRVLPLAYYAGTQVATNLFWALVAAYGAWAVRNAGITSSSSSSTNDWETSM